MNNDADQKLARLEMWTQRNAKLQAENAELKKANYWQVEKIETWQEKDAK